MSDNNKRQPGVFYACSLGGIRHLPDAISIKLFAVRIAKTTIRGWKHNDTLCPSSALLFQVKRLETEGKWNSETFDAVYRPRFEQEMRASQAAQEDFFHILNHLRQGDHVAVACYCVNPALCHRSLLAEYVSKRGFATVVS